MAFHIVTNKCFLACDKVTSVVIEEVASVYKEPSHKKTLEKAKKANKPSKKPKSSSQFYITISYYPLSPSSHNSGNSRADQENTLEIRVKSKEEADRLFKEIIGEVQEQHPNEAYLDKLVGKLLGDEALEESEPSDAD